jgi:hypothetical protein
MEHVKPIETGFVADRFSTTYVDETSAPEVVQKYLERRIDEIDALVSLLGMARKLPSGRERFGYDPEYLDEIVMRRVRKLVRACQETVTAIVEDDPENPPAPEDFGPFED